MELPWDLRALLRELLDAPLDIPGREVEERGLAEARLAEARRALSGARLPHVVQQPADVAADELRLERPGRVRVADRERQVRHVAEHHPLVAVGLRELDAVAVDGHFEA